MKKALGLIGKIAIFVLCGLLALIVLLVGVLNLAKFAVYGEYYSIKENICKNPGLSDGFVCQGIAACEDDSVFLVSGYMKDGSASRIYVTTLENKVHYISLESGKEAFCGHAGGVAVSRGIVYLSDGGRVYTLLLSDLLKADNGSTVEIGAGIAVNNNADFIYTDDKFIYVGEFHDGDAYVIEGHENKTAEGEHHAICSKYEIGKLGSPVAIYSIRNSVQGICFTPEGKVVMSTSYGLSSSHFYVYDVKEATDAGITMDGAPVYYLDKLQRDIKGPAMSEGLDVYNGKVITLFESASNKYIFGKFFFANKIVALDLEKN